MEIYHNIESESETDISHKKSITTAESGYCILSPPGSGKTTVAAAMAASLVKDKAAKR